MDAKTQAKLADLALRMGRARRSKLDAAKVARLGFTPTTETLNELSAARGEYRKASNALWRLVAKIDKETT